MIDLHKYKTERLSSVGRSQQIGLNVAIRNQKVGSRNRLHFRGLGENDYFFGIHERKTDPDAEHGRLIKHRHSGGVKLIAA